MHAAFQHMQNNEPETMTALEATCFEHEVAWLMYRYRTPEPEALLKAQRQRQVTPDEYMHAFEKGLGIQCERFASPLDFSPEVLQYSTAPNGKKLVMPRMDFTGHGQGRELGNTQRPNRALKLLSHCSSYRLNRGQATSHDHYTQQ